MRIIGEDVEQPVDQDDLENPIIVPGSNVENMILGNDAPEATPSVTPEESETAPGQESNEHTSQENKTETTPNAATKGNTANAVNTDDTSNVMQYLCLEAFLFALMSILLKKKRER